MAVSEAQLKKMLSKYKYRDLSTREILHVTGLYRDLKPLMDSYVFNDGSSRELLNLTGTIPVPYKGNTYNIPICLWLLDTYPFNPPICFVKPTSTMTIKTGKHVDANGKIYLPYLHEWKHPPSDLLGLIQILIVVFGEEPPVFSRSAPPAQFPMYPATGPPNRASKIKQPPRLDAGCDSPGQPGIFTEPLAAQALDCYPESKDYSSTEGGSSRQTPEESEILQRHLNEMAILHRHEYCSLLLAINNIGLEQERQHEETITLLQASFSNLIDVVKDGFQQLQASLSANPGTSGSQSMNSKESTP